MGLQLFRSKKIRFLILFGRSPTNHRYLPAMHGILLFDRQLTMYGREPPRNRELDISHREANNAFNRGNVPSGGPPRAGGQGSAGVENEIYRAERFYFRWVGKKGFRLSRGVTKRDPLGPKKIRTQHGDVFFYPPPNLVIGPFFGIFSKSTKLSNLNGP